MPYVKWMLGAEDLTPEDDMPIGRNVLELNDVRQSANYTCVAMSTLGVIEAIAQITVKGISQAHIFGHSSVFSFIHCHILGKYVALKCTKSLLPS